MTIFQRIYQIVSKSYVISTQIKYISLFYWFNLLFQLKSVFSFTISWSESVEDAQYCPIDLALIFIASCIFDKIGSTQKQLIFLGIINVFPHHRHHHHYLIWAIFNLAHCHIKYSHSARGPIADASLPTQSSQHSNTNKENMRNKKLRSKVIFCMEWFQDLILKWILAWSLVPLKFGHSCRWQSHNILLRSLNRKLSFWYLLQHI